MRLSSLAFAPLRAVELACRTRAVLVAAAAELLELCEPSRRRCWRSARRRRRSRRRSPRAAARRRGASSAPTAASAPPAAALPRAVARARAAAVAALAAASRRAARGGRWAAAPPGISGSGVAGQRRELAGERAGPRARRRGALEIACAWPGARRRPRAGRAGSRRSPRGARPSARAPARGGEHGERGVRAVVHGALRDAQQRGDLGVALALRSSSESAARWSGGRSSSRLMMSAHRPLAQAPPERLRGGIRRLSWRRDGQAELPSRSTAPMRGFDRLYGLELLGYADSEVRAQVRVRDELKQPAGLRARRRLRVDRRVDGLAGDGARGDAARATWRWACPTARASCGPITEGVVHAHATRLHRGRTTWVWDVRFSDDAGPHVRGHAHDDRRAPACPRAARRRVG